MSKRSEKRLSLPALAIALIALFVGVAGTAVAAKMISGKQIKNESVTGQDVKDGSLTAKDGRVAYGHVVFPGAALNLEDAVNIKSVAEAEGGDEAICIDAKYPVSNVVATPDATGGSATYTAEVAYGRGPNCPAGTDARVTTKYSDGNAPFPVYAAFSVVLH